MWLRNLGLLAEPLEARHVELVRIDTEHIPRRSRQHPIVTDRLAQMRDVDVERLRCARRLALAPEVVPQPFCRDDLVRVQEQDRQQGSLLRAAEREESRFAADLKRPEDPELHFSPADASTAAEDRQPTHSAVLAHGSCLVHDPAEACVRLALEATEISQSCAQLFLAGPRQPGKRGKGAFDHVGGIVGLA